MNGVDTRELPPMGANQSDECRLFLRAHRVNCLMVSNDLRGSPRVCKAITMIKQRSGVAVVFLVNQDCDAQVISIVINYGLVTARVLSTRHTSGVFAAHRNQQLSRTSEDPRRPSLTCYPCVKPRAGQASVRLPSFMNNPKNI